MDADGEQFTLPSAGPTVALRVAPRSREQGTFGRVGLGPARGRANAASVGGSCE
jgi:hypothetical protein